MARNTTSTRFKASCKMENTLSGSIAGIPSGVKENIGWLQKHGSYRLFKGGPSDLGTKILQKY